MNFFSAYTDGYGFSTRKFTTDDPEEIDQLLTEDFWSLTSTLVEKHAAMSEGSVPAGWNEAVDVGWVDASGLLASPTVPD